MIQALCKQCYDPILWIDCPTGGWWAHETASREVYLVGADSMRTGPENARWLVGTRRPAARRQHNSERDRDYFHLWLGGVELEVWGTTSE